MRLGIAVLFVVVASVVTAALPTSLVADAEEASNKVKRAEEVMMFGNQQTKPIGAGVYYANVKKREAPPSDAEDPQASRRVITHALSDVDLLANMRRAAMDKDENSKTAAQYEKGYLYGVGKDALDKHAENTLLKSEVYGEPINEYRYYGGGDVRREERKIIPKKQNMFSVADVGTRLKRDLELDPESLLALISLWQAQRNNYPAYRDRSDYSRYGYERADDNDVNTDEGEEDVDNGEWMGPPVPLSRYQYEVGNQYNQYPGGEHYGVVDPYQSVKALYFPPLGRVEHKRAQWGGFAAPDKRFMVSKRRQMDRWEEPSVWSRLLASQPRDPMPGMIPHRRVLL